MRAVQEFMLGINAQFSEICGDLVQIFEVHNRFLHIPRVSTQQPAKWIPATRQALGAVQEDYQISVWEGRGYWTIAYRHPAP